MSSYRPRWRAAPISGYSRELISKLREENTKLREALTAIRDFDGTEFRPSDNVTTARGIARRALSGENWKWMVADE